MEQEISFGPRIRKLRRYVGMSGEEFGRTIGISKQTLSLLESGKRVPSAVLVKKIAEAHQVDVRYFFGWIETVEEAVSEDGYTSLRETLVQTTREIARLREEIAEIKALLRS
jgi:transcriptional regulator with XRE-family HTH domain